jgi:15-cis-phytoene desaturase
MEGAVFGGKLAAEVVAKKAKGITLPAMKEVEAGIVQQASIFVAKDPLGVKGEGAIAFGGGASLTTENESLLREVDPAQFA